MEEQNRKRGGEMKKAKYQEWLAQNDNATDAERRRDHRSGHPPDDGDEATHGTTRPTRPWGATRWRRRTGCQTS